MASKRKTDSALKPPDISKADRIKDPAVLGACVVNTYNRINKGNGQAPDLKETMQAIMADIAKVNRGGTARAQKLQKVKPYRHAMRTKVATGRV